MATRGTSGTYITSEESSFDVDSDEEYSHDSERLDPHSDVDTEIEEFMMAQTANMILIRWQSMDDKQQLFNEGISNKARKHSARDLEREMRSLKQESTRMEEEKNYFTRQALIAEITSSMNVTQWSFSNKYFSRLKTNWNTKIQRSSFLVK